MNTVDTEIPTITAFDMHFSHGLVLRIKFHEPVDQERCWYHFGRALIGLKRVKSFDFIVVKDPDANTT